MNSGDRCWKYVSAAVIIMDRTSIPNVLAMIRFITAWIWIFAGIPISRQQMEQDRKFQFDLSIYLGVDIFQQNGDLDIRSTSFWNADTNNCNPGHVEATGLFYLQNNGQSGSTAC